jgi:hypothetical protein
MSLSETFIFLLVGLLVISAILYWFNKQKQPQRRVEHGKNGEVVRVGEVLPQPAMYFQGRGTAISKTFSLRRGTYRFRFQFPDAVRVKVDVASISDGEAEMLVFQSGTGTTTFQITTDGRYNFHIEPMDENAHWQIQCDPLGLPSRPLPENIDHQPFE